MWGVLKTPPWGTRVPLLRAQSDRSHVLPRAAPQAWPGSSVSSVLILRAEPRPQGLAESHPQGSVFGLPPSGKWPRPRPPFGHPGMGASAQCPHPPCSNPRGLRSLPPLPAGGDVLCNTGFHFRSARGCAVGAARVTARPSQRSPRTPQLGQSLWLLNPQSDSSSCLVF